MKDIPVGIQLYTVRDLLKGDFKGVVREIAKMGYKGVEFAGQYGDMANGELAAFLGETGLKCCGMHVGLADIANAESDVYKRAKALGCSFVTTSLAGRVAQNWAATIKEVAVAGDVAKKMGVIFTYHNHAQEFEKIDGQYALDQLYAATDPKAVQGELDTYWIKKGGADPVAYIRKYTGRVPQVHLKDMDKADGSFTEVGNGLMDLPGIFAVARDVGARWVIVEQDTCKRPSIDSARISIENLRKAGLA